MVPAMSGLQISMGRRLAALAASALLVSACSSESAPEVPEGSDGSVDSVLVLGRDVYGRECSACHGTSGGGKRGPRLGDGSVVERFPDPADQAVVVAEGRGAMPAFGSSLTAAEIEAVVAYTREVL